MISPENQIIETQNMLIVLIEVDAGFDLAKKSICEPNLKKIHNFT